MIRHAHRRVGCCAVLLAALVVYGGGVSDLNGAVVRFAICQTGGTDGDLAGNLALIEAAVEKAAAHGADLAIFPECALLGWVNPDAWTMAHPIPGEWSDQISAMAAANNIMIFIGMAELADASHLYDAAILVGRDGTLLGRHRKLNVLFGLMDPPYSQGSTGDIQIAVTEIGRVGMLICADVLNEQLVRGVGMQGQPDWLLVPYGFGYDAGQPEQWPGVAANLEGTAAQAAIWAGCPVIGCNRGAGSIANGPWTGTTYGGHSVVSDENGNILAVAADLRPDVMIYNYGGITGDFDADGDVDLTDYGDFLSCYNGPGRPKPDGCVYAADFDADGDVDLEDYGAFIACYSGPDIPSSCSN
jgi:predicted amidohydrolase